MSLFLLTALVAGCKLNVIVPPGGNVESSKFQASDCAGGNVCEIDITDPAYSDSFNALPNPGYEFVRWQKGTAFFCGDSTATLCEFSLPGGALGAAAIALFETAYIMPVWKNVGIDTDFDGIRNELDDDDDNDGVLDVNDACPLDGPNLDGFGCPNAQITDSVCTPFGEDAQPDLFRGVTIEEVRGACPENGGIFNSQCSGALHGFDVNGWGLVDALSVQDIGLSILTELPAAILQGCVPGNPVCVALAFEPMVSAYQIVYGFRPWVNAFGTLEISGYVNDPIGAYAGIVQLADSSTQIETGIADDCSGSFTPCGGSPTGVFLRRSLQ
jgi:hypothetical protein